MTKKNAFRRGFTLIELMIVIVILGILMGTILPRLTGAQSRARDTARIADLNNISQALEVYFSDHGKYPDAACTDGADKCGGKIDSVANIYCISSAASDNDDTYNLIKGYMKGNRVPQNVGKKTTTLGCVGSYYYNQLKKGGSGNASYVLASDLETWQMANYELEGDRPGMTPIKIPADFTTNSESDTYIQFIGKLDTEPMDGETANELASIYIVIP